MFQQTNQAAYRMRKAADIMVSHHVSEHLAVHMWQRSSAVCESKDYARQTSFSVYKQKKQVSREAGSVSV